MLFLRDQCTDSNTAPAFIVAMHDGIAQESRFLTSGACQPMNGATRH
jgi:hypothetical protein